MKFSLIIATLGRTVELERLFRSLARQTHRDFEAIVVDQNPDERLQPLLSEFANQFPVIHLRSPAGLSRARNCGLQQAGGDVIGFPDDDCWYEPDFLARVVEHLECGSDVAGCAGPARDPRTGERFGRWRSAPGPVSRRNVFTSAISFTLYVRRQALEAIGGFDETLGVGAPTPWQSGEETDLLIRIVDRGFRVEYSPSIEAYHENKISSYDAKARERTLRYSRGCGRVLRKHRFSPPFILISFTRPLAGTLLALVSGRVGKARVHWNILRGRVAGYFARQPFVGQRIERLGGSSGEPSGAGDGPSGAGDGLSATGDGLSAIGDGVDSRAMSSTSGT